MCEGIYSFFLLQIGSMLKKLFEEGVVKREDLCIVCLLFSSLIVVVVVVVVTTMV